MKIIYDIYYINNKDMLMRYRVFILSDRKYPIIFYSLYILFKSI